MNEDLRRFLLVAKEGHLTRTAEKLFITQSALTQSIHRLEKDVHAKLFQQHGKLLQLTDEGRSLVMIGEKMQMLWDNASQSQLKTVHLPTYSLGLFDNAALRLSTFFSSHIKTDAYSLEISIASSQRLLTQLQLGALDAAICVLDPIPTTNKQITLLHSFTEKLIPVSAKVFSEKIEAVPFILYNQGSNTRKQIDAVFLKQAIQPTIFAESTSTTFMKELAILGAGVALLPENVVLTELRLGKLKKQTLPLHWQRNYGLYSNNQSTLSLKHTIITDICKVLRK